jgi:predicted nucleic acid-binding protein
VNVLVDTSVWSLALRRRPHSLNASEKAVVAELSELIAEGRARIIGLIRQELLSGIRDTAQFTKLREVLRAFPDEPVHTADYEAASEAGNQCRKKSVAVSVSDMLMCAISMSRDWPVYSSDPDFARYARILPLRLHAPREQSS